MKSFLSVLLLLLALCATCFAQEVPTENPAEVWVKGRLVQHAWSNGRILVSASQLQPLLDIDFETREVDLLEALEQKGGYVWSVESGVFKAIRDRSLYASADPSRARRSNQRAAVRQSQTKYKRPDKSKSKDLGLTYEVVEVDTEWGYKWGAVRVTNTGQTDSDVCTAYCEFQDGFGRTYSEDWWPVRSLKPGESMQFDISSGKETKDLSITPTRDNIAVYFFSREDVTKNPKSRAELRQQARKNKRGSGLKGPTLDLRRNEVHPERSGIGWE